MLQLYFTLILSLLFAFSKETVKTKPQVQVPAPPAIVNGYFMSPVRHDIKLAGTFCELRPNHFHTGIDIKSSAGVEGDDIYAVADGFVSRIGISPTGYGYALYIDHPNGFTSVYGHLKAYDPIIAGYALQEQQRQKRFDIQYYPDSTLIRIKKGQVIGKMGNSGSSKGAHLHFEIRETRTEIPINPLLFGFAVSDNTAPGISYARIYDLDEKFNEFNARNLMAKKRGELFVPASGDTVSTFASQIGLGINARDGQQGNWNKNGIYAISMLINDTLAYQVQMDSVSFERTRMINAHLDYPEQRLKKNYVHKCYSLPGNILQIIKYQQARGVIYLKENEKKKVRFEVIDFNKNKSVMEFYIKRKPGNPAFKLPFFNYSLPFNQSNIIRDTGIKVIFTERTFFKDQDFMFKTEEERSSRVFSNIYTLGDPNIPVFDYYPCTIHQIGLPATLRSKAFIASCDEQNKESNWGGIWDGDWLTANLRAFGSFYISVDTLPPSVVPVIYNANMTRLSKIVFRIDDNVAPAGQTPLLNCNAYLDNNWIPMEYDLKTKTITYVFPKDFPKGPHKFRLEVFDALGNTKIYSSDFTK